MWQQFLAQPWVRAKTATRVTALQLPSHLEGRADRPPERRRAELGALRASLATAEGRERFEAKVLRETLDHAAEEYLRRDGLEERLVVAEARVREADAELAEAGDRLVEAAERLEEAEKSLLAIGETRTWRLRARLLRIAPLRALVRVTGRDRDP
jgi:multidrug resistance efflux pump